jgi:DNA-binding XRE family transcriptional regulator
MRLTDLKTHSEMLAEHLTADAEFRAEWQRTALAREVAAELIRYRSEHGLNQRQLAKMLGVSQPRIVELESGEKNPKVETLIDISRATGIEFTIDIGPAKKPGRHVVKSVRDAHPAVVHDDVAVLVAAG